MADNRNRPGPPGPVYNTITDNLLKSLLADRLSRREFLRRSSVIGLSMPAVSGVLSALGVAAAARPARAGATGGVIRVGQLVPQAAIEPVRTAEMAGIIQLSAVGEYLCLSGPDMALAPMLALSWQPNADGSVWTFKLRPGVKFHNGKTMSADDVVATFERLADPDSESNALTLFNGYLSKGGARKIDPDTVEFHLDAPHGNFPYLVSSENYNAIVLPADYAGDFEANFVATGPFRLEKYTPRAGSSFVRNPDYWGAPPLPGRIEYSFLVDAPAMIAALKAGQIDVLHPLPLSLGREFAGDAGFEIIGVPTSAHHQVHMRNDMDPFRDPRVRRAVALCLDRPALVRGLTGGHGDIGNDSPFAPAFPSTDKAVPQRAQAIAEARQLMQAAGLGGGFDVRLTTENYLEIPAFARAIQEAVKPIGGRIELEFLEQSAYFGDGVFGKSPWLDSAMGITDYDHRGVPNVCLTASLRADGGWNAARYRNPAYDAAVARYIAALDIDAQRQAAGEIETLLLADTPVLFAYFHHALTAVRKGVTGVKATATGHLLLAGAAIAAN